MAELSDIEYVRSSVQFASISDVSEINAYNKIKLDWKFDIYDTRDIVSLTIMRVILNPGEKADLSDSGIQKRFKTIFSWQRTDDTAGSAPPTTFTDEFKWDDMSDNGLHNLNYANDLNWNYRKFRQVVQRICSGEQGIMYKIFGYSRRMSRGATPIGFFCDVDKIVALSQKNQMIKDRWYGECQEIWSQTRIHPSHGNFVRVSVDMVRDLTKQSGKERRVWASTTNGYVYCFDYWTGRIIGSKQINTNIAGGRQIYALSFNPTIDRCVVGYSDGENTYIALIWETADGIDSKTFTINGGCDNDRITGGICTTERNAGVNSAKSYFYMIFNKEMVMKYELGSLSVKQFKRISRDHFGCLSVDIQSGVNKGLAIYQKQNNIHGIGAGINGQVWANGHTPVTVTSHILEERPTGKLNVRVRVGRGGGRGCKVVTQPKSAHGACNSVYASNFQNANDGVWIEDLLKACPGFVNKHWGTKTEDWNDDSSHWVQAAWNYSASLIGQSRDAKRGKRARYQGGCAVGLNSNRGVDFVNWAIKNKNVLDTRWTTANPWATGGVGAGQEVVRDNFNHLPAGGPDNDNNDVIWYIHQEILEVSTDTHMVDVRTERPIMQDLNFVYGCNENENLLDTNGQLEDNNNAMTYRSAISAKPAEYPTKFFKTMTNWCSAEYAMHQYGFAGRPFVFDWNSTGNDAPYSFTSKEIESVDKQVGKPHIPSYGYDANVFNKIPGNKTVIAVGNRKDLFTEGLNPGQKPLFRKIDKHGDETYCDIINFAAEISGVSSCNEALAMSIGSVYPRIISDGRMYVDKVYSDAYYTNKDKLANGFSYELLFADRREGKIGFLKYKRPRTVGTASTEYIISGDNRRLKYENDENYEYYMDRGLGNQLEFLDRAAYHVTVDSDNNVWTCSPRGISKIQLLTSAHGLEDKYVYDRNSRSGLYLYETENTLKEVCVYYMNKHAKYGAKYKTLYRENGIENGEGPNSNEEYASAWAEGHKLMTSVGMFSLESSGSDNLAYLYNYNEWQKARGAPNGCWEKGKIFAGDHFVWKRAYTRGDTEFEVLSHKNDSEEVDKEKKWLGNQNNEYNDDNFGVNCLIQLNKVELGPDITYPVIKDPNAKSKITKSVSRSNNDVCDTQDGSAFWDSKTLIFNDDQSTSGYDDLDTTHFIYDIEQNYRHLLRHRYNYNDFSNYDLEGYFDVYNHVDGATQPPLVPVIREHDFEYEEGTYDLVGLENVLDNWPTGVWHTPNYWGLVPPYQSLSSMRKDHWSARPLYVDLFIDYVPSVYNVYYNSTEETLQVGHHEIHVFERWPTGGFCLRGRGNDEMTDVKTGVNKLGLHFWRDCANDDINETCPPPEDADETENDVQASAKKKRKRTIRRKVK